MNKIYLIGFEYDDFDDGGFSVIGVTDTIEQAINMINKAKELNSAVNCIYKEYELNKICKSFYY